MAQLGRAPASGAGGRGFKSHQPDNSRPGTAKFFGKSDFLGRMKSYPQHKITIAAIAVFHLVAFSTQAVEVEVNVGRPPGVINFVYPEYPPKFAPYAWSGKGLFLLKVNSKTGIVDEVKVLRSTGHVLLNEFSVKAFFQWRFQPGGLAEVQVPVEFYAHGFSRSFH